MLYKAQEEADPLGSVPKKESKSKQESAKDGSAKSVTNGESSTASASKKEGDEGGENNIEGAANNGMFNFILQQLCVDLINECHIHLFCVLTDFSTSLKGLVMFLLLTTFFLL